MASSSAEGSVAAATEEVIGDQTVQASQDDNNTAAAIDTTAAAAAARSDSNNMSSCPENIGDWLCNIFVQGLIDDDVASIQQQLSLLKRAAAAAEAARMTAAETHPEIAEKHAAIRATMENLLKNTAGDILNVESTVLIAATRHQCSRTAAALMAAGETGDDKGVVNGDVDGPTAAQGSVEVNRNSVSSSLRVTGHKTGDRSIPQLQHILTAKRNRLRLFGSAEGTRIRLDTSFQHRPVRCASKPAVSEDTSRCDRSGRHRCLLCSRRTTTQCSHCTAALCRLVRVSDGAQQQSGAEGEQHQQLQDQGESCFDRFHRLDKLPTPGEVAALADSRLRQARETKQHGKQQDHQRQQEKLQHQVRHQLQLQLGQQSGGHLLHEMTNNNMQGQQQNDPVSNDGDAFHVQHGTSSSAGVNGSNGSMGGYAGNDSMMSGDINESIGVDRSVAPVDPTFTRKRGRGRPRGASSAGTTTAAISDKRQKAIGA